MLASEREHQEFMEQVDQLSDADIQKLIQTEQATAEHFTREVTRVRREINPLEQRLAVLRQQERNYVFFAQGASRLAENLEVMLHQRHVTARKAEAVTRIVNKLHSDAENFGQSSFPISRGLARVAASISEDEALRSALPDIIDFDVLSATHNAKRIKVKAANGDSASVRMDTQGVYMVSYHPKEQTPAAIRSAIADIHAVGIEDPYVQQYSLRVNPYFLGLGVDLHRDQSVAVTPVVLLEGQAKGNKELRVLPQAESLALPIVHFVGMILQKGAISLPKPQQSTRSR